MRLSQLVEEIADVIGWPEQQVNQYARHAREAGFITQGARGNAAPQMTSRDAAHLLTALLNARLAKNAGIVIPRMYESKSHLEVPGVTYPDYAKGYKPGAHERLAFIFTRHTFVDFLTRLIEIAKDDLLNTVLSGLPFNNSMISIRASVLETGYAEGSFGSRDEFGLGWEKRISLTYSIDVPIRIEGGFGLGDMRDSRWFSHKTIEAVGAALR